MENSADLTQFIGRLHLVLLHLPIGFLVLLGVLELISMFPRWRHATLSNRFVLYLTPPVAVATAFCGWLLGQSGEYDPQLLLWHRWTGVGVAVLACLLLWVHTRGWLGIYRVLILATVALTVVTGHLGGSLTHGRSFLIKDAPSWLVRKSSTRVNGHVVDEPGAAGHFDAVQPVFAEYCVSCHGPEKSKGGLRLDSLKHVLAGGDSGPVVVPGKTGSSVLWKRVLLPLEDDDHMPPEGKPQPAANDLERFRAWIESGARE